MKREKPAVVLTIAGSDPSAGAGLQADLKTFAAFGVYGLAVPTALTVQNTGGVDSVTPITGRTVAAQIRALLDDFDIGAIKIGMLGTAAVARAVVRELRRARAIPVVLDPVLRASRGARLLDESGIDVLRSDLLPLVSVLTPNLPEAEVFLGTKLRDPGRMPAAARALLELGPRAVLLKGGHLAGNRLLDLYADHDQQIALRHRRVAVDAHGTGCALSAALAARLAQGASSAEAARDAVDYVYGALRHAFHPGKGVAVLDHFWRSPPNTTSG